MDLKKINSINFDFQKNLLDHIIGSFKGKNDLSCFVNVEPNAGNETNMPTMSPYIKKGIPVEGEFIVFYPKWSSPYDHELDGVRKKCTILMGRIYEEVCGKTYMVGDEFEIPTNQKYRPYTKDSICVAHIKLIDEKG